MLYDLKLDIAYDFARPLGAGRQLLRVLPARLPGRQEVIRERLDISPLPQERREFTDFFGTRVVEIAMPAGLTEFRLSMTARIRREAEVAELDLSPAPSALAQELAAQLSLGPVSPHHFLGPSPRIPRIEAIAAFARKATAGTETLRQAVDRLGAALHDRMIFDAEATEVDTPPDTAFALRRGVCQDFAQIMIAGLRSLGIPAAYVAGYLRTLPPPGKPRLEGADAMHAWVAAWCGAEMGWVDHDPTNDCWVGTDHVTVGMGRDYGDVAPITGVLRTDGGQSSRLTVDFREAGTAAAAKLPDPGPVRPGAAPAKAADAAPPQAGASRPAG